MMPKRTDKDMGRFFLMIALVLLAVNAGCSKGEDGRTGEHIGEEELADIIVDMAKAKDEYRSDEEALKEREEALKERLEAILKERSISWADIEKIMGDLRKDPKRWERVLITVQTKLQMESKTVNSKQ